MQSLDAVYREHGRGNLDAFSVVLGAEQIPASTITWAGSELIPHSVCLTRRVVWRRECTTDEWLSPLVRHPERGALAKGDRGPLFEDLRKSIELQREGMVATEYTTLVIWVRLGSGR